MTTQKIVVQQDGLYLMTCPIKLVLEDFLYADYFALNEYNLAMIEARKPENLIRFKEQEEVAALLPRVLTYTPRNVCYSCLNGDHENCSECSCDHKSTPWWMPEVGSEHEIPTGYRAEVEVEEYQGNSLWQSVTIDFYEKVTKSGSYKNEFRKVAILKKIEPFADSVSAEELQQHYFDRIIQLIGASDYVKAGGQERHYDKLMKELKQKFTIQLKDGKDK